MAPARIAKLRKKADAMGIIYTDDTSEAILSQAVKDFKASIEDEDTGGSDDKVNTAVEIGTAVGRAVAKEMASVVRGAKGDDDNDGLVREEQFDPKDLTDPATYFVPMIFWILPAKQVGSQLVMAPYKKIVFKLDQGSAIRNGSQFQTRYTASFTTSSKKEQAHLETHPYFNRVFFKSETEVSLNNNQVRYAQRFALHMQSLNNTMAPQLYQMSPSLGVKLNHDMSLVMLRTKIAEALTQRDMDNAEAELKAILTSSGRAELLSASQE